MDGGMKGGRGRGRGGGGEHLSLLLRVPLVLVVDCGRVIHGLVIVWWTMIGRFVSCCVVLRGMICRYLATLFMVGSALAVSGSPHRRCGVASVAALLSPRLFPPAYSPPQPKLN